MDRSLLWRAALVQALAVVLLSLLLALALPGSFFDDWGWLSGPLAWFGCAAITAWTLRLPMREVLLGALLAAIPSAIAVLLGIHWLGLVIAIAALAAWCASLPGGGGLPPWLRRARPPRQRERRPAERRTSRPGTEA